MSCWSELEGDLDIIVGFASVGEQTAIVDIANGFSHSNIANLGIEVYDAIGEFTNCISGLFATAFLRRAACWRLLHSLLMKTSLPKEMLMYSLFISMTVKFCFSYLPLMKPKLEICLCKKDYGKSRWRSDIRQQRNSSYR